MLIFLRSENWPFWLSFIQLLIEVISQILAYAPQAWLVAFSGLVLSHGVSFVANFLLAGEHEKLGVSALMFAPYGRIVIIHCAVLLGGAIGNGTGSTAEDAGGAQVGSGYHLAPARAS